MYIVIYIYRLNQEMGLIEDINLASLLFIVKTNYVHIVLLGKKGID